MRARSAAIPPRYDGTGRCREDQHKGNHREADSGDRGGHEHVIGVGNVEAEDVESDVLKRLDVAQNRECEEREEHRKGG